MFAHYDCRRGVSFARLRFFGKALLPHSVKFVGYHCGMVRRKEHCSSHPGILLPLSSALLLAHVHSLVRFMRLC